MKIYFYYYVFSCVCVYVARCYIIFFRNDRHCILYNVDTYRAPNRSMIDHLICLEIGASNNAIFHDELDLHLVWGSSREKQKVP